MLDTSIITGKAYTGNPSASNSIVKRLYLKIFPGEFWYRAPRVKKAKVYGGELFVRYSNREWPEKKNGPLVGDPGLLSGISDLLKELKLVNVSEIQYAKLQHSLKETLTITVGPNLAKEIVDRGWAKLIEFKEPKLSKDFVSHVEDLTLDTNPNSEVININEVVDISSNDTSLPPIQVNNDTVVPSITDLYSNNTSVAPVKAPVKAPVIQDTTPKKILPPKNIPSSE